MTNSELACTEEQFNNRDFADCDCITARTMDWETDFSDLTLLGLSDISELKSKNG